METNGTAPSMRWLRAYRAQILAEAQSRHLENVRVFGSVASGDADSDSDVDLLVRPTEDASVFDLAGFMDAVQDILGLDVDVVSDRGTGPTMDRVVGQAVVL